jgi:hypothetical protein
MVGAADINVMAVKAARVRTRPVADIGSLAVKSGLVGDASAIARLLVPLSLSEIKL